MNIGDKVTVLPIEELDKVACYVESNDVYGIGKNLYNEYVGKEYTISDIDNLDEEFTEIKLLEVDFDFTFPIGCIKKI